MKAAKLWRCCSLTLVHTNHMSHEGQGMHGRHDLTKQFIFDVYAGACVKSSVLLPKGLLFGCIFVCAALLYSSKSQLDVRSSQSVTRAC